MFRLLGVKMWINITDMTKEEIYKIFDDFIEGFHIFDKEIKEKEFKECYQGGQKQFFNDLLKQVWIKDYVLSKHGIIRVVINDNQWYSGDKFFYPQKKGDSYIVRADTFRLLDNQYEIILKDWAFKFNDMNHCSYALSKCDELVKKLNNK